MSTPEHTPGPWSACGSGKCRCKTVGCKDHPIAKVTSGEWGDIDPADGKLVPYGNVPEEEAIANAQLIAAAPDLLSACELLLSVLNSDDGNEQSLAYQAGNEAIRKARGQ